ncbi:PQQ-binding-like beta-propeller repeat protein [Haloglomus litoreum]|uniref:PQQ-binding-like beta-propeller repeat protein n=1 Tax=Haloglomus litoreum TaxID=3034026 RepID=UPI0023E87A03|nr:PQQ-binding-like beta-propeller repeat protein [Haloglomus sp. DT116]
MAGTTLGVAAVPGAVTGRRASDGLVYAASETGELAAFSVATGEKQWSYEFPNNPDLIAQKGGPPLVWNGTVYLGAQELHAVDAATGEREWVFEGRQRLKTSAVWPPTVHDGTVYVVQNTGGQTALREEGDLEDQGSVPLYALDAETGEREWRTESPMLTGHCQAPLVYDGTVFVLGYHALGGALSAYDAATGAQSWGKVSPYGDLPIDLPQYGPVEVDGIIYIMGGRGGLPGFDPETGETVSRGGANGRLAATPYAPTRGKLSAFGSTLLSASGSTLDRFMPARDGERVPGTTRGGNYPFDNVGELGGVDDSFRRSAFVVGRPTATRHPYLVVGAQRWKFGVGAEPEGDARFQATSMNPTIPDPDPEWVYSQRFLVNPTVAGRTVFIGGEELTALDLQDGTVRWSSDAIDGRIVTAPTVAASPEGGHSIDERIRHQTLNHHDELGPRPANVRVGIGRLSAAGVAPADEYWFPDGGIDPPSARLNNEVRYVGRVDTDGRVVVPRSAVEAFQAEHDTVPGVLIQLHNTGAVTAEKSVDVRVGGRTRTTTVPLQGYGAGFLCLFEERAAVPGYAQPGIEADSARSYLSSAALVDIPGEQLVTGGPTELTVSTPDHERTIRFGDGASSATPEPTESRTATGSPTERTGPEDDPERTASDAAGPGFGVVSGLTALAAGGYARYVSRARDDGE